MDAVPHFRVPQHGQSFLGVVKLSNLEMAEGDRAVGASEVGLPAGRMSIKRLLCLRQRLADATLHVQRLGATVIRGGAEGRILTVARGDRGITDLDGALKLVDEQQRTDQERPGRPLVE